MACSSKQLLDRARDAHSLKFKSSDILVLFPDFPLYFRRLRHHLVPYSSMREGDPS
ncbi:unnamed protein product [Lupinus luteus]|uniref:Uncharacterized protein n=1 Tax=Lupinus luteus TaxID=3873 RepID=A0AAV1WK30_LUPLU